MANRKTFLKYLTLFSLFLGVVSITSDLFPCAFEPTAPEDMDNLSFIEPTCIGRSDFWIYNDGAGALFEVEILKEWKGYFANTIKKEISEDEIKNMVFESEVILTSGDVETDEYLVFMKNINSLRGKFDKRSGWQYNY